MAKDYIRHDELCGCERCARQADSDNPQPVYDVIDNPELKECGCHVW